MPIIKTRLVLNEKKVGDELVIIGDDVTFHDEFLRFCQLADLQVLEKTPLGETPFGFKVKVLK